MSRWCETCTRKPYDSCDSSCPVFGSDFVRLAEKLHEQSFMLGYLRETNPMAYYQVYDAMLKC